MPLSSLPPKMRRQGGLDNLVALKADLAAKVSAACAEDTVAWIALVLQPSYACASLL
jgi:hypothetical protein